MLGKGGRVGGEAEARPESKAVGERVRSGAGVGDAKAICATGGRKWEEDARAIFEKGRNRKDEAASVWIGRQCKG